MKKHADTLVVYEGRTMRIKDAARLSGIRWEIVRARVWRYGWSVPDALRIPMRGTEPDPMIDAKFGRLTVFNRVQWNPPGCKARRYLCVCDCGKAVMTKGRLLRTKRVKSCGCHRREISSENLANGLRFGTPERAAAKLPVGPKFGSPERKAA